MNGERIGMDHFLFKVYCAILTKEVMARAICMYSIWHSHTGHTQMVDITLVTKPSTKHSFVNDFSNNL